jgi:predicted aspartyl protease
MISAFAPFARLGLVWLLLVASAAAANGACRVEQVASVPIRLVNGHPLVRVMVNDQPATFILDSGAERTLMGEDVVRQLDVARDTWVASTVLGVGGYQERPNALPRSMRLGDVTLRRRTVTADTSVTVGPLPISSVGGQQIAGLLGRDFLSPFDLDIDVSQQRLMLYDVQGCSGRFLPWAMPYAAIPATTPVGTALVVPIVIDGRRLRALVDTGASSSLIAAPGMYRLGLTPQMMASDAAGTASGIGPAAVFMRRHRFAEMQIGPDTTRNPMLWVATVRVVPIVDMLLGADWLGARRVWLSFATKQVFVVTGQNG